MTKPVLNEHTLKMARELRRASRQHEAPIWKRISEDALKPSVARRTVNIRNIAKFTKDGDMVAVPGKVLGVGDIGHSVALFSFGISESAHAKIVGAGGRIIDHNAMISERPTGSGVVLLG